MFSCSLLELTRDVTAMFHRFLRFNGKLIVYKLENCLKNKVYKSTIIIIIIIIIIITQIFLTVKFVN